MEYKHVTAEFESKVKTYIRNHIEAVQITDASQDQYKFDLTYHEVRIVTCVLWMYEWIMREGAKKILVVGDHTIIDWCLAHLKAIEGKEVLFTNCELREHFPYSANTFDLVIDFEVLEHLKDKQDATRDLFEFSGAYNLLGECARVLKPGKVMVLSTPNMVSLKSICRMFLKKHPYMFYKHVREYTPDDMRSMFPTCGMNVELLETINVWDTFEGDYSNFDFEQNVQWKENKAIMERMLADSPFDKTERGDDMFVVGRKK
ncbi:MAG: mshA [Chitinophagaceae bacterium]|nr:mshA [Chitinophagaceae bacterium]